MKKLNGKLMLYGAAAVIPLLFFVVINPFGYNDMGYREVVETPTGQKNVVFTNGVYFKFPGSKVTTYPNVITISHRGTKNGSTIEEKIWKSRKLPWKLPNWKRRKSKL